MIIAGGKMITIPFFDISYKPTFFLFIFLRVRAPFMYLNYSLIKLSSPMNRLQDTDARLEMVFKYF